MTTKTKIKNKILLKKEYLEIIALFFYSTILLLPLIFLRCRGYKLARIKSGRVGHLVSETFSIKNDVLLNQFKIIFLIKKNDISNTAYIEMFKQKYDNIFITLPNLIHRSFRLPNIFTVDVASYHTDGDNPIKSYSIYANSTNYFKKSDLPKDSNEKYKKLLGHYKVKNKEKIVVLHFRSHNSDLSDEHQHLPRNIKPDSYSGMINYLCNKGFRVVRIGDPGVHINVKYKENYIDYGNSKFKSSYLDLALCANCDFFIGSSSGAICIAAAFKKPILGLNLSMPFNFSPTGKSNEIGIPKLIRNKRTKQILSLKEIYNNHIYKVRSAEDPLMRIYEVIDNDENDLTKAAEEMLDFLKTPCYQKKKYTQINNLIRSFNNNFEVDAGSLSNFSISFYKKHKATLLKGNVK